MTREDVKKMFPDATEEQVTAFLNAHHAGIESAKASVRPPVDEAELQRLLDLEKEYEKQKQEGLSESEKLQALIDEANKTKADFTTRSNRLEAEKILLQAGVDLEEYEELINGIVSDDLERTLTLAKGLATMVSKTKEATAQKTKEELMDKTTTPQGGAGKPDKDDKKLTEAEKVAEGIAKRKASSREVAGTILEKFV